MRTYMDGEELLGQFDLTTREQRLEQAVKALMDALDTLHKIHQAQSLDDNLTNPKVFCSCADAYRMGAAALSLEPANLRGLDE